MTNHRKDIADEAAAERRFREGEKTPAKNAIGKDDAELLGPAHEPEPWCEPAVDARAEMNPLGDQASHAKQLNDAFELACAHPMENKVQSRFRDLFLAYRDRYVKPDEPPVAGPSERKAAKAAVGGRWGA